MNDRGLVDHEIDAHSGGNHGKHPRTPNHEGEASSSLFLEDIFGPSFLKLSWLPMVSGNLEGILTFPPSFVIDNLMVFQPRPVGDGNYEDGRIGPPSL